jgi:DNA replication licensing factor MCM7
MAATAGVLPVANFQIDYPAELDKITEFLSSYVPPPRAPRRGLPSDDDEDAEEEDNEDDLEDGLDNLSVDGRVERSKAKYMKVLRKVANRQTSEVIVDLGDLIKVSCLESPGDACTGMLTHV